MRKYGWELALDNFIKSRLNTPFAWGYQDCALFACDCIKAMTGDDPAAWFRGRYDSEKAAYAALKEFAGGGLLETAITITQALGYPSQKTSFAQRGDIALAGTQYGQTLGIVALDGLHVWMADVKGLSQIPLKDAVHSWRVP